MYKKEELKLLNCISVAFCFSTGSVHSYVVGDGMTRTLCKTTVSS